MTAKKILLTGATGFVGRRIFRLLTEKGYSVRCLLRPSSDAGPLQGAEVVRGNVWDANSLKGALDGVESVVHLVGIIQDRKLRGNTFEKVHFEGTRNLVEESKRSGVRKFVHMSALGARPDAVSRYHRSKWKAEEAVRGSGMACTIFQPSVMFGELPCAFLETMIGLAKIPLFTPVIGSGEGKLQPVYVEDVARCFEESLRSQKTNGQTYPLGGKRPYTFVDLITRIETRFGKKKLKMHLPLALMGLIAFGMDWAPFPTPLSRDQLVMLKEDNVCDPGVIERHFGFAPVDFDPWLDRLAVSS